MVSYASLYGDDAFRIVTGLYAAVVAAYVIDAAFVLAASSSWMTVYGAVAFGAAVVAALRNNRLARRRNQLLRAPSLLPIAALVAITARLGTILVDGTSGLSMVTALLLIILFPAAWLIATYNYLSSNPPKHKWTYVRQRGPFTAAVTYAVTDIGVFRNGFITPWSKFKAFRVDGSVLELQLRYLPVYWRKVYCESEDQAESIAAAVEDYLPRSE